MNHGSGAAYDPETITRPAFPRELWPSQQRICAAGVLRGASAVIQMPTSAGKTRATDAVRFQPHRENLGRAGNWSASATKFITSRPPTSLRAPTRRRPRRAPASAAGATGGDRPEPLAVQRKAELTRDRLKAALPRLQARHQQVADAEEYGRWAATFDQLKPRAAADRLKAIYQKVEAELIPALAEARAMDGEVRGVANLKPYHLPQANGEDQGLPTVEAAARALTGVNPDFSLMTMRLPAFDAPNQLAWPPYEVPLAVQVAASMVPVPGDPRQYTASWWKVQQERAQAAREQQQREQQERQAGADANYHGPRWWERDAS